MGQLHVLKLLCYYVLWTLLALTDEYQHYKEIWKHTVKCSAVRSEELLETACRLHARLIIFMKLSRLM